jgi:hypothetical protein
MPSSWREPETTPASDEHRGVRPIVPAIHFVKTRRSLLGALLGVAWSGGAGRNRVDFLATRVWASIETADQLDRCGWSRLQCVELRFAPDHQ